MHLPAKANSVSVQTFMANESHSDSDNKGGKVISVARLEMAKYRTKGSKWSYLEDNYRASGNTEWSTNESSIYSQSSRKKVERKGDTFSKTCNSLITS